MFNLDEFKKAMSNSGVYRCAASFFWISLSYNAVRNVPVSKMAITDMQQKLFSSFDHYPVSMPIVIAIPTRTYDVSSHLGALRRVSPEEPEHAMIFAMSGALDAASDEEIEEMKTFLLSVPFEFRLLPTESQSYFHQINMRESLSIAFAASARSNLQRVFELMGLRAKHGGTAPPAEIARIWNADVKMSKLSEAVTGDFARHAITVWDNLLLHPRVRAHILRAEEEWGKEAPFNSVYKLAAISSKSAGDPELAEWCCAAISDLARQHLIPMDEFSIRNLSGSKHKPGILDLVALKRTLLSYLLTSFLDQIASEDTKKSLKKLGSHADARKAFGNPSAPLKPEWFSVLPKSGLLLCTMILDSVYNIKYDNQLRNILSRSRTISAEALVSEKPMSDVMDDIRAAACEEGFYIPVGSKKDITSHEHVTREHVTTMMMHISLCMHACLSAHVRMCMPECTLLEGVAQR